MTRLNSAAPVRARSLPSRLLLPAFLLSACVGAARAETVALWLFDEQAGVYPSSVLADAGPDSHFLLLGRGAEIVPGKFGRALRPIPPPPLTITAVAAGADADSSGSAVRFGLAAPPAIPGRTQPPLLWSNAHFAALTTRGDAHLRRAPLNNVTESKLNLGDGAWTVEAWLFLDPAAADEGVILELGAGPRGENDLVTRLSVLPRENSILLAGLPAGGTNGGPAAPVRSATTTLSAARPLPRERWFHVALVHRGDGSLRLFIDGQPAAGAAVRLRALPQGEEAYLSVGRDGRWERPFPGAIDELRISDVAL